ncbi:MULTISPECIES: glutathione-disulfide reductase [unclassified Dyella]|uniref:glutathione-disulfide reductase n=1 Tax=unclassified Dyella TaxID=2634549 RepID=UPI000C822884|nr:MULTISPECIES: glutathione-disulfide reductase [unclassified Dyella]MDR3448128.1 glutathione-disulfide reductase [Dyella sp.]PMQ05581.1 Glutathione amide reductase [Dyella sp. AD56]
MAETFDLIVLGGGSGGLATAIRAARHGARVALLEPGALGGTCVNVGCVPKKALWYAGQLAREQRLALDYGFALSPGPLDWEHFRQLRQHYIDGIRQRYAANLATAGIQVFAETGRFVSADIIATSGGEELHSARIVIATGGRPRRLDLPGFDLGMVSDDIFALRSLPKRIAVIGGGYIAIEFAGLFNALGSEVSLHVRRRMLTDFDIELVDALEQHMGEAGIRVTRQVEVTGLHREGDAIVIDDAVHGPCGSYDAVLWAVGRIPNSERLDLEAAGVRVNEAGYVVTDTWQNTNVDGIFAVGDITGRPELTPVAVAAGRRLADRLFGGQPDSRLDYDNIPSVVFAEPPLAMVGLTESEAREQHGEQVRVYRARFTPLQWAVSGRHYKSLMKIVCAGEDERVVGMHVLGSGADEMLQGFAVAMKMGLRKRDLDATVAIHPSSAEELVLMS